MAGLPKSVINRAKQILNYHLSQSKFKKSDGFKLNLEQVEIFEEKDNLIKEKILGIDINSLTPIEALVLLEDLKKTYDS